MASSSPADHPRIRGEHVRHSKRVSLSFGSSPHTRGARELASSATMRSWIIPAYAGSTFGDPGGSSALPDHPRIRGEHVRTALGEWWADGSSPHTRGAPPPLRLLPGLRGSSPHTRGARLSFRCRRLGGGIIPAYAGSTSPPSVCCPAFGDHPRIRGEHTRIRAVNRGLDGSSPHTRGAHLGIPAIPRIAAVIIPVFLYPSPTPQEEADRSMVLLTLS